MYYSRLAILLLQFQKIPGVVAFISAKDIPGENNYLGLWGAVEPVIFRK